MSSLLKKADGSTFVIAEIGNNHEGDMGVARELVEKAAETGVDAVKFQTFIPEKYADIRDDKRMAMLARFRLTFDQFADLAGLARDRGLIFISTPLDLESAAFLADCADALKIASGDNTFYPLVRQVAESGKPMIISTGLAGREEISKAVACVTDTWSEHGITQDLALLHCLVSYPAPPDQANLNAIKRLATEFPDQIPGYSDHTIGVDAARIAVSLGAKVIEKHFTLDTAYSDFRDHQLSADPETMTALVKAIREAESMLGAGDLDPRPCEEPNRVVVRRSVTAARDLTEGNVLGPDDIVWTRPGGGIPPGSESVVLGKRLTRALKQGDVLKPSDVG